MARRYRDRTDKFRVGRDPDVQTARIYFVCPVNMFTVSLIYLVDEDHLRHHRIANSALSTTCRMVWSMNHSVPQT